MATAIERLYKLTVDASQANKQLKQINRNTAKISGGFSRIQRAATSAFGALGALRGLQGLTNASDQIELLEGSFVALTGSSERASDMLQRVFSTVADTGASLKDTSSTFQRLTIGLQELGATNSQVEDVANSFIKLGRISGTSMFDTNAALVQFSQGLASGKLQGDELRSIMERLPLITRLIADEYSRVNGGITVTRGEVKELGRQGKLTAEIIANAMLNATDDIAKAFADLPKTLEQELNILASTWTQFLATLSVETNIGDNIKAGIRGVTEVLSRFARNLPLFIKDLKLVQDLAASIILLFSSLAYLFYGPLIKALKSFSTALLVFGKTHPWLIFLSLAAAGIALLVANWERVTTFLVFELPIAFKKSEIAVYKYLARMDLGWQNLWKDIKNYALSGFKYLGDKYNEYSKAISDATLGGLDFGSIDTTGLEDTSKAISTFTTDAADSTNELNGLLDGLDLRLKRIAEEAKKRADEESGLLEGVGVSPDAAKEAEELQKRLDKLQESVLNASDPLREFKNSLGDLYLLLESGRINEEQFANFVVIQNGSAEATEKAAKAWADYVEQTKRALDPQIELREEYAKINRLWEEGIINMVELGILQQKAMKDMGLLADDTKEKLTGLNADLSKAGNSFLESFSTGLADALLEGSLNFSDFAESILKDLARMILRAVIFNSLMSGLEGTAVGDFLGIGAQSAGASGNSFGVSTLAAGDSGDSVAGIITPPTYGPGGRTGGSGEVSVTVNNNAPVDVTTTTSESQGGGINIDLLITQKVNSAINNGAMDKSLASSFGIKRRGF